MTGGPTVAVLRDYHAENLIWLPKRQGNARVGLLDYQDMLIGHPAYDLMALLEDARRDTAPALRAAMLARYLARSGADAAAFAAARGGAGRPAQPEDPRALHPALPARRQAALSRPTCRGSGRTSRATWRIRTSRRWRPSWRGTLPPPDAAVQARIGAGA